MSQPVWRPLILGAVLAVLAMFGWLARQGRAAETQAARTYALAVTNAARQAWQRNPARPFLEVGSAESCLGPRYRRVVTPARVTACEVTRLPVGFEVSLTLGRVMLTSTTR